VSEPRYLFVPRDVVQAITEWETVESLVAESLAQEEHILFTLEDVRQALRVGRMKLWIIYEGGSNMIGVLITAIESGSNGKALSIIALTGTGMPLWVKQFSDEMTAYAKKCGCRLIFEMGRPGWTKVLAKHGWVSPKSRIMLKMVA
jgi:hypothetical protein